MATAHAEGLRCVGVMETDERHGKPDFALEKSRARTGGKDGGPVHEKHDVEMNLKLLDEVCFTPFRRQEHEVQGMLVEVVRQAAIAPRLCLANGGGVAEGVPPGGDFGPEPEPMPDGWEPEPEPQCDDV
eukprot:COSAG04_NODE_9327_length_873_cov_1.980620_2_plen_129_part_01